MTDHNYAVKSVDTVVHMIRERREDVIRYGWQHPVMLDRIDHMVEELDWLLDEITGGDE